ncbi:hypothetical protein BLNAU_20401 [Blattamonas nauphoetae]|uniref:Uncharacterized protein n=1 Tax=Blattamonas nauphoetae TaxID=2049346 RepID=A0ABQ9WYW6_9EUKA|nr:hypothetical protein BLNAU_20401 [Blattamonas nauphoetae]
MWLTERSQGWMAGQHGRRVGRQEEKWRAGRTVGLWTEGWGFPPQTMSSQRELGRTQAKNELPPPIEDDSVKDRPIVHTERLQAILSNSTGVLAFIRSYGGGVSELRSEYFLKRADYARFVADVNVSSRFHYPVTDVNEIFFAVEKSQETEVTGEAEGSSNRRCCPSNAVEEEIGLRRENHSNRHSHPDHRENYSSCHKNTHEAGSQVTIFPPLSVFRTRSITLRSCDDKPSNAAEPTVHRMFGVIGGGRDYWTNDAPANINSAFSSTRHITLLATTFHYLLQASAIRLVLEKREPILLVDDKEHEAALLFVVSSGWAHGGREEWLDRNDQLSILPLLFMVRVLSSSLAVIVSFFHWVMSCGLFEISIGIARPDLEKTKDNDGNCPAQMQLETAIDPPVTFTKFTGAYAKLVMKSIVLNVSFPLVTVIAKFTDSVMVWRVESELIVAVMSDEIGAEIAELDLTFTFMSLPAKFEKPVETVSIVVWSLQKEIERTRKRE